MGKDLFKERKHRFSIRKFSVGVASVMVGTLLLGANPVLVMRLVLNKPLAKAAKS